MKIALHTGKGGVGKTTISAATAIACAIGGARTLLVSTDPAHSIADVLGVAVDGDPTEVPGVPNLWAAQVDTRGRFEQSWSHIRGYLVGVLAARGMAEVQAEELTVLPGAEEIVALLELRRLAESGDFDAIIVDCAPTGETLRLLALPETIGFYAQRLLGAPQRVLRSIAASLTGLPGSAPNATVRDALGELLAELMAARALLADPAITGVRLVLDAGTNGGGRSPAVVHSPFPARLPGRGRHGQPAASPECRRRVPAATARRTTGGDDPGGGILPGPADPSSAPDAGRTDWDSTLVGNGGGHVRGGRPAGRQRSTLRYRGHRFGRVVPARTAACRFADRGDIALSRSGADLVVTVGDVRRRIALPSILQRCSTEGASFEQGRLMIDFAADPALWPAGLTRGDPGGCGVTQPPPERPPWPSSGSARDGGRPTARCRRRATGGDEALDRGRRRGCGGHVARRRRVVRRQRNRQQQDRPRQGSLQQVAPDRRRLRNPRWMTQTAVLHRGLRAT